MYIGFLVLVGAYSFIALRDKKKWSKLIVKGSVCFLWVLSLIASAFIYVTTDKSAHCGRTVYKHKPNTPKMQISQRIRYERDCERINAIGLKWFSR